MIGAMIGAMLIYLTLIVDYIWLNLIGVMSTEGKCPQFIKGYTSTHQKIKIFFSSSHFIFSSLVVMFLCAFGAFIYIFVYIH
jgi:hypothetical protein